MESLSLRSLFERPSNGSGRVGFAYGAEVVTTRGYPAKNQPYAPLELIRNLLADSRIAWCSVTDNPGGGPMLPPDWLAAMLPEHRHQLVVHMTCKDQNRNALESSAWRYAANGINHILALSGDAPTPTGFAGQASPTFDIDSPSLIAMLDAMNDGICVPGRRLGTFANLPKTDFFIGCCVSPFKRYERELLPQYLKLRRKLELGARWVLPQLGYDMRKFHEIRRWLCHIGHPDVPVIGNVYLLNKTVAKMFHDGRLPGCVVSPSLWETVQRYATGVDKGKTFFVDLAAKMLAVFRGLGFVAGYLGGMAKSDDFFAIIEASERFGADDWKDFYREIQYSLPDEYFLFDSDPMLDLAENLSDVPASTAVPKSSVDPVSDHLRPWGTRKTQRCSSSTDPGGRTADPTLLYRISRIVHYLMYMRDRRLWKPLRRFYRFIDTRTNGGRHRLLERMVHKMEWMSKNTLYGCRDCGDCSLPETAFLCPMNSCRKNQRNGPCGGSRDGRCEVPDKECIWSRVYVRLSSRDAAATLLDGPLVVRDAELDQTSAWANAYLDRDHAGRIAAGKMDARGRILPPPDPDMTKN